MKTNRYFRILLLSLFVSPAITADQQNEAQESLLQADQDFARLSQESDPKQAFAAYLAPNVIMIPRAGPPINGFKDAIASFGDVPGFDLYWQPQMAEVADSGELGWTWGTYQVLVEGQQIANGKYVNIWNRQSDGNWKVRMDMGNQEPAQGVPEENQ